jgi:uncharacterized protein YgbK (DUF1537 family)
MRREDLLDRLPIEWPEDLMPDIRARLTASGAKVVVLDDDPTGTQTVYGVPVLTQWPVPALVQVLAEPGPVVYILTNSRSVPLAEAQAMNREIAANLAAASQATGKDFVVVSRSDSTLRGHYPGEVETLAGALGHPFDATLIIPFFQEGGRLTVGDVHYVADGAWLIPVAETEYARDATFGYAHSDLRAWVSEKQGGRIRAEQVASIPLDRLRTGGPAWVYEMLLDLESGKICVVNAVTYRDLEVFVAGLLQAEAAGQRFLYRTAASFVRVRGGLASQALLTVEELEPVGSAGGLIVAGSYTEMSTHQIQAVLALQGIVGVRVTVERLLDRATRQREIGWVTRKAGRALRTGQEALVYTSRRLVQGQDAVESLEIGRMVSAALVEIVRGLDVAPGWIIAKGGITASDVATAGLGVERALVLGQAIPGVPVWRTGAESRWPGLVYVVFPGNVGGPEGMAAMIGILRDAKSQETEGRR